MLQKVRVSRGTSTKPDTSKQATAFPPNYIRSFGLPPHDDDCACVQGRRYVPNFLNSETLNLCD